MASVRAVWLLALVVLGATPEGPPSQKAILARAAARVARYSEELPRLVATETMSQQITPKPGQPVTGVRRQTVAEFGWVPLSGEKEAIGFRDVIEVDGRPVGSSPTRLVELLHGHAGGTLTEARAILNEGARYNLVPGSRNFNLPTVVVYFLEADRQARFRWTRRSRAEAVVWEMEFHERSRPTVIRTGDGRSINSRGRVWIEAATGEVMRTALELEFDGTTYAINSELEYVAAMDLVLPVRLEERHEGPDGVVVTATAVYSNYRRFQTGARLIP